ncbi:Gfo/Idh/MocA family protein [Paenibacillus allorhizosphaerae]|uniref:Inositol 2-dehydrogenase/D-chiro-inositol 3-dehydrogenase n=1 Tax=Paenibacillus allorhizosphaerae TaxID=2849866 RepID=A0ABN7TPS2_9BACL|nr:Gfo/Idh/MocA family oxidoreductase [Paenibacillus allorhizosphaerae]CAG7645167.1 Inositol 2-dehydrogenase/D-chiro-inositol 3-dehydrogenase [Paenibacillus allorhizosphaerae]
MSKLKIIQIGVGGFGRSWLRTVKANPDAEMAAVVDVSESNLAEAKSILEHDALPAYQDYREAIRSVAADAVLIVTPPRTHIEIALFALEAGLHVLTEKPLSYSFEEAMTLYEKRPRYGKQVTVNQNYRWTPEIQAVKDGLTSGVIGKIAYVDWTFRRMHNPRQGTWRVQSSDFLFTDVSVHHFDLMRYLLGTDPIAVCASGFRPSWSWCEGNMVNGAFFRFPGEVNVHYFGSLEDTGTLTPWNGNFRLVGNEGAIELTDDVPTLVRKDGSKEQLPLPALPYESKGFTLDAFVRSVRSGAPSVTDLSDNIRTFLMVDGAIQSAREQRWVDYDFPADSLPEGRSAQA